ncbi:MAG: c-type cytochrome biogenesis protein CcmI [Marinobacter sp.]|uniref:c-type cytochrome biogenesis protein CcmI n=1 Tax=Marinobacter sp. TaxID=50741 RepID=UPI00349FDE3F
MTTTFWLAATALMGLALAFILFPLFFNRPQARAETDLRNQNLLAYRGRMAELEAEHKAGILDDENYRQLRDELAGSLLDDVSDEPAAAATEKAGSRRTGAWIIALGSVVLIPALAVYLYQHWGAMDDVEQWVAMKEMSSEEDRAGQMNRLSAQLRERLEESPDNPEGWAMLGRTYMSLERYPDAAWAFERLAEQTSESPGQAATALGLAAQARFFESRGDMNATVSAAIEAARAINPDEVNALGLLGIHAFEQKQFEDAIGYWERIAEVAPNHPQLPSIRQGVAEAYQRLGREAPAPVVGEAEAVSERGVTVRIELSPAFNGQVPDDTTLFIYARRPGERSAPLAVARSTAGELPLELRLTDAMSMTPTATISDAEEVVIAARLSPAATAMPRPGDWQGALDAPVAVTNTAGGEPVELLIDKQLR